MKTLHRITLTLIAGALAVSSLAGCQYCRECHRFTRSHSWPRIPRPFASTQAEPAPALSAPKIVAPDTRAEPIPLPTPHGSLETPAIPAPLLPAPVPPVGEESPVPSAGLSPLRRMSYEVEATDNSKQTVQQIGHFAPCTSCTPCGPVVGYGSCNPCGKCCKASLLDRIRTRVDGARARVHCVKARLRHELSKFDPLKCKSCDVCDPCMTVCDPCSTCLPCSPCFTNGIMMDGVIVGEHYPMSFPGHYYPAHTSPFRSNGPTWYQPVPRQSIPGQPCPCRHRPQTVWQGQVQQPAQPWQPSPVQAQPQQYSRPQTQQPVQPRRGYPQATFGKPQAQQPANGSTAQTYPNGGALTPGYSQPVPVEPQTSGSGATLR